MVKIKLVSGPRAGQENLAEMTPRDLIIPAREGWRWEVDWSTVPEEELFSWAVQDMSCKVVSCLIRGGEVLLQLPGETEQKWSGVFLEELAGEIEDAIVNSGYNVLVLADEENQLIIGTDGRESSLQ